MKNRARALLFANGSLGGVGVVGSVVERGCGRAETGTGWRGTAESSRRRPRAGLRCRLRTCACTPAAAVFAIDRARRAAAERPAGPV